LSKAAAVRLQPRKTPRQARSTASVEAILEATIQVLVKEGRARLTTTRVAQRAGVSVGTLYQYFPNKSSMLQALLKHHLDGVAGAVEQACEEVRGKRVGEMAEAITGAFVQAKFRHLDASAALYAVSDDVEGKRIARGMHVRVIRALGDAFATASDRRLAEPMAVAEAVLGAMAGVSRSMLERGAAAGAMAIMDRELTVMVRAYLQAAAACDPTSLTAACLPKDRG